MAAIRKSSNLSRSALIGTSWLLIQNVGSRVISFGSQIILAKLLAPSDFGVISLALTVTTLASVVANFGVDDVLLQRQKTLAYWASSGFAASLALGLLSFVVVAAVSPLVASMYHSPILVSLLPLMALALPLTALSTVPTAKIRADLNFRLLAGYTTIELAITQLLTIGLAIWGFGVYSFAIPVPLMALLRAIVFWMIAKPRLGKIRLKQLKMMGSNSAAVFGAKILTAAVGQGDYFVLGLFASKSVVGAYFFAFRLAIQPVQLLAGNLSNVLFPILSQLRNEPERQKQAALNASRVLAFVVMPYCFLQAAIARPLLTLVFGAKWLAAIPLVEILSIGLAFDAVSWVAGALLQARGEFRRSLIYSCVFFPIFFTMVTAGALYFSGVGVAIAVSSFYIAFAPVYSYKVFRKVGISLKEIAGIYVPPVSIATAASLASIFCEQWVSPNSQVARILLVGIVGGTLYLGLVHWFVPSAFHQILERLRQTRLLRAARPVLAGEI